MTACWSYRGLRPEAMLASMNAMSRTVLLAAAVALAAGPALSQSTTRYDVKTINFDLWCQEQAKLPPERCDRRLPEDEKQYEAYRDTIEKYEIPYLQDKQRAADFDTNIMHHDPIDNPKDKQQGSSESTPKD